MFSTIRYSNVANGSWSLERTPAPFEKKRQNRQVRFACSSCRASKLKCSGEPNGCWRCLAKDIECQYPEPLGPPSTRGGSTGKGNTSQSKSSPKITESLPEISTELGQSDPIQISANSPAVKGAPPTRGHDNCSDRDPTSPSCNSNSMDIIDSFEPFEWLNDFSSNPPDTLEASLDGETGPFTTKEMTFGGFIPKSIHPFTTNGFGGEEAQCEQFPLQSTLMGCVCLERAINRHEAIEVDLIWSRNKILADRDILLQNQKNALADLESLLKCEACTSRSSHVMLLASMCRRLIDSLDLIKSRDSLSLSTSKKRYTVVESDGGNKPSRSINIGRWRLDEDDELHVLNSLVSVRLVKLANIIGTLETVANHHNWPAHRDSLRDMQEVLRERYTTDGYSAVDGSPRD